MPKFINFSVLAKNLSQMRFEFTKFNSICYTFKKNHQKRTQNAVEFKGFV